MKILFSCFIMAAMLLTGHSQISFDTSGKGLKIRVKGKEVIDLVPPSITGPTIEGPKIIIPKEAPKKKAKKVITFKEMVIEAEKEEKKKKEKE